MVPLCSSCLLCMMHACYVQLYASQPLPAVADLRCHAGGAQEEARSDASTAEAPWSTGSSCGGEVVQVVHEGWDPGALPATVTMPALPFPGERLADSPGAHPPARIPGFF